MELMRTPRSMDLDITNQCNLRCSYCSHFSSAGEVEGDLPTEEWLEFFEELNRCGVMQVTIGGGEPFVRKDLRELIEGIARNRMRFSILTNGTLVTEELAEFIASTGRCDNIQISIDGADPESHDVCRGAGNFVKAVEGLQVLRRFGVPVSVRVTIHRHNVGQIENIARFLLEEVGLPAFSTNSASHMGLCRSNAEQVQLSTEERTLAMATLSKLAVKYGGRVNASAGPMAELRAWTEMVRARREGRESMPGRGYLNACGSLRTKMAVRADGMMVPCVQMSHIELGRINRDELSEVWRNHPELDRIRKRRAIALSRFSFCDGCDYIPFCTGNCPAIAYNLLGEENHPSPDACLRRFLESGGRLPDDSAESGKGDGA